MDIRILGKGEWFYFFVKEGNVSMCLLTKRIDLD